MRDLPAWAAETLVDATWFLWLVAGIALLGAIGMVALAVAWTLETVRGWLPTTLDDGWVPPEE